MALLTDQIQATGVSLTDLIHIVITGDTSQNPAGSSFKASIQQVAQVISGTTGTSGTSGSRGSSGSSGLSGSSGSSGTSGISGTQGVSGSSGSSGANGSSGSSGANGSSGSSGLSGSSGSSGTSGISGTQGASGSSGSSGLSGSSGSSGNTGTSGSSGSSGLSGSSGTSGNSGTSGSSGSSGSSGNSGSSGSSGSSGTSGTRGSSGSSGASGTSGSSGTSGINGIDGTSGINGIDGALSARWVFDTTYTPPGAPVVSDGYFYADSTTISSITQFTVSRIAENSVNYYAMLLKLSSGPGVIATITEVTDNSIIGSWDIRTITNNTTDFIFEVDSTLAANGSLNNPRSYSISFSVRGANGTQGVAGTSGTSGSSGGSAWGAFVSTVSQYVVSTTTAYSMSAATQTSGNGVTVSAGTRFVVASAGTYNLQFSCQIESTGGGSTQTMDIWLAINGNNVANSNTQVVGNSNNGRNVAAWNFVEPLNAGDYMELKYRVSDVRLGFAYDGPQITPTRPAIPSVIVTVTQV